MPGGEGENLKRSIQEGRKTEITKGMARTRSARERVRTRESENERERTILERGNEMEMLAYAASSICSATSDF